VSTTTSAPTDPRVFFLSSNLFEASHQLVGSADRHPSENIRGEERISHNVTHQHTYEDKHENKSIYTLHTMRRSIKTRITPLRSKHTSSMSSTYASSRLTQTLGVAAQINALIHRYMLNMVVPTRCDMTLFIHRNMLALHGTTRGSY
jgi:hypothetical protein